MKKFSEFNIYELPNKFGDRTFEEFLDLNSINNINEGIIEYYYRNNFTRLILRSMDSYIFSIEENLKTYDSSLVVSKLKKLKGITSIEIIKSRNEEILPISIKVDYINEYVNLSSIGGNILLNTKESEELYNCIDFFNYYITNIERTLDRKYFLINIEPRYTKLMNKEINNNCDNIVYHITKIENKKNIERLGLRPKVGKTQKQDKEKGYRYFTSRIYFIGGDKNKTRLKTNIMSVLNDKQLSKGEYIIIKINLKDYNFPIYIDSGSQGKYNLYTFTSIPPYDLEYIEDINNI